MPFYDTLVAAIQAKLAEIKGARPVLTLLFGKGPTGEPVALAVDLTGNLVPGSAAPNVGTQYHGTTPTKTSLDQGPIEVNKRGCVFVAASARHSRRLDLTLLTAGITTAYAALTEGPCDAIETDTDNLLVFRQPPERPLIASQTGTDWTCGAGWTYDPATHLFTHAAGGGTADLEITPAGVSQIGVGETYCAMFTATITAGTSVTNKLGTAAGTARTVTGPYSQLLTATGNGKIIFTPTNDLACTIDARTIYVIPPTAPLAAGVAHPQCSAIAIVAIAAAATPTTPHTTAKLFGHWLRRAGATELT